MGLRPTWATQQDPVFEKENGKKDIKEEWKTLTHPPAPPALKKRKKIVFQSLLTTA